ncbi:MAG: outer membrane beta-barrel protein [Alcanivoracaceae bacterium]
MKNSLRNVMLLAAIGATPLVASATEEGIGYIGVNYFQVETDDRFFGGDSVDTGDLVIRVGGKLTETFTSELRVGMTAVPEEQGGIEYKNDYYIGGMLRMQKAYAGFTPYLGISYTFIKESLTGAGSATLRDFGYAAGADIRLGEKLGVNLEYWVMTGDPTNDIDRKGPSVGVFYRF